jgi:hypothetical protein
MTICTTNIVPGGNCEIYDLRCGEAVPALRVAGILPAIRGRDALDTNKGKMPSPQSKIDSEVDWL